MAGHATLDTKAVGFHVMVEWCNAGLLFKTLGWHWSGFDSV